MHRGLSVLVAALVVLTGVATPVAAQGDEEVTLTVSVVDRAGASVSDAELTATWDGGAAEATTAGNGKAFLDVPAGANVSVAVSHRNYVRNAPYPVRNASESEVTVPVSRGGTLSIDARDADGPVSGARVILRRDGAIIDDNYTDESGTYVTDSIERGEYSVVVRKSGYYRNVSTVEVDGRVERDATLRRGSVSLRFNVTDPHYSPPRPVGGVTLALGGVGEFRTLASGEQTVRAPVNSQLDLQAGGDAYETTSRRISIGEAATEVNVSVSRTPAVNLTTVSERVVAGERVAVDVVDEYGEPIPDAQITLDGEAIARTDDGGRAVVRIGNAGDHDLRASADGVQSEPVTVSAVSAETETATATSTAAPTAGATETATATETPAPDDGEGGSGVTSLGFTVLTGVLGMAVAIAALLFVRRD